MIRYVFFFPLLFLSSEEQLANQAERSVALVPIRVEFETETHRIRDCFVWNLHESLVSPEEFARTFCADLDLPAAPWSDTVAAQIRAQLEDQDGVGSMELAVDGGGNGGDEVPECRVILSVRLMFPPHLAIHFTELHDLDRCAGGQPPLIRSYRVGLALWTNTRRVYPPTLPRPRTCRRGRASHRPCNP